MPHHGTKKVTRDHKLKMPLTGPMEPIIYRYLDVFPANVSCIGADSGLFARQKFPNFDTIWNAAHAGDDFGFVPVLFPGFVQGECMPRLGPADIRIRDAQGNVRTTVDVSGDRASATVNADVSADGVVSADVQASVSGDGFDANVAGRASADGVHASAGVHLPDHDADANVSVRAGPGGLGVRTLGRVGNVDVNAGLDRLNHRNAAGFAGVRVRGDNAAAGVTVNAGADGPTLSADVDAGGVGLDASLDASGNVSAALDLGGDMVDGLDVRFHARRRGDRSALGGGTAFRLSRYLALPDVKLEGETERVDPSVVDPDDSRAGQLRARMLATRPGEAYEKQVVLRRIKGGAERKIRAGVAGVELGFSGGKSLRLTTVRLRGSQAPEDVAPDAADLARLQAGERFELEGDARMRLEAEASGQLGTVGTGVGLSAGISSELVREGEVRITVDKEEGSWARVRLRRENATEGVGEQTLKGGPTLPLAPPSMNNFAADLAIDYVRSLAMDWVQNLVPINGSRASSDRDADILLREFRLDLSDADVREALDHALTGDWTPLDAMTGNDAVVDLRTVTEKQQKDSYSHSLRAFGLKRTNAETFFTSERDEKTPEGKAHVSEHGWSRKKEWEGWLGSGHREMAYSEKKRSPQVNATRAGAVQIPTVDSVLEWNSEQKLKASKPRQLQRALGMAGLLEEKEIATRIRAEIRRFRSSAATQAADDDAADAPDDDATLLVSLRVDDDGIQKASSLPVDELWQHCIEAWGALHPGQEKPLWAKPGGRESLDNYGPLRHGHADYAPYHEVRVMIDTLKESQGQPKHEVMRALRAHLEEREYDPFWVALLAKAVGPDHRQLAIQVADSDDDVSASPDSGASDDSA